MKIRPMFLELLRVGHSDTKTRMFASSLPTHVKHESRQQFNLNALYCQNGTYNNEAGTRAERRDKGACQTSLRRDDTTAPLAARNMNEVALE
jgi:hypothetical protein